MKIELWMIGKTNDKFIAAGIDFYRNKLIHFEACNIVLFSDIKSIKDQNMLKQKEAEKFLEKIKSDDFVILLDERGSIFNSKQFADFMIHKQNLSIKKVIFIIGGAFGFDEKMYQRANAQISLSPMTFSHQLIRIIFLEQLYRAFTIIHNFPYHND
jgi:23S rRNA (pseudouridine1915-N3)-methyltransferase